MTTSLAFMLPGRENKIEFNNASNKMTVLQVREKVCELMAAEGMTPPELPAQVRLIYHGRILKDNDILESLLNPDIEPPITLMTMIRPKESVINEAAQPIPPDSSNKCCLLY